MAHGNPNFPDFLNIHPSTAPSKTDGLTHGSAFDSTSQENAIRLYGIAGRVWWVPIYYSLCFVQIAADIQFLIPLFYREAAYLLTQYLCQPNTNMEFDPPCSLFAPIRPPLCVVELGSGTGFVGINLAKNLFSSESYNACDDIIILTDLPDVCSLLSDNISREKQNQSFTSTSSPVKTENLIVHPLPWGVRQGTESLAHVLNTRSRVHDRHLHRHITHVICSDLVSILSSNFSWHPNAL